MKMLIKSTKVGGLRMAYKRWSSLKKLVRKEESHSPSPDQEKEIALPQTNDSGNSHSSDLLGKSPIAARVACIDILDKTTRTIETIQSDPEQSGLKWDAASIVDALDHIAFLARFGAGIPNPDFRRISTTGNDITEGATTAFKTGIAKYPPHSAEETAWADGYATGFSDQDKFYPTYEQAWDSGYAAGFSTDYRNKGEDPGLHPGPVERDAAVEQRELPDQHG